MKTKFLSICTTFLAIVQTIAAQDTVPKPANPVETKLWGNIFASYYYNLKGEKPLQGFEMPTALLGYSAENNRFKGTLVFDVARTTGNINVVDSSGTPLTVLYREGSNYTVFLKMAELKYSPAPFLSFRMGQLLNTQYLTTQDKFWGFRYVYFTFQEVHRYGNPADFGFQTDIKLADKGLIQLSATNGEGPFRYQDNNGKIVLAGNAEWYPVKGMIIKFYADYAPSPETTMEANYKSAFSFFTGYKTERLRFAIETNWVKNYGFSINDDYAGSSVFMAYKINPAFEFFARHDYINRSATMNLSKANFVLGGVQYQPNEKLQCALSLRTLSADYPVLLFFSAGGRF